MTYRFLPLLLTLLLAPVLAICADAPFLGKVVAITDGDTLKVLTDDRRQIKIRLAEIDCPEKGQPWGKRAKQTLSQLAFSKFVLVEPVTTDRYGRMVATIFVDDKNINETLVRNGHCWTYRKYVKHPIFYALEDYARNNNLGLWRLPESKRVPPWQWRRKRYNH